MKAETVINESGVHDIFELIYTAVISNIKNLSEKRFRLDYWFNHKA